MDFRELREAAERHLGRIHLVCWLGEGVLSLVSSVVIGSIATIHGWGWVVVASAGFGIFVATFIALTLLTFAAFRIVRWWRSKSFVASIDLNNTTSRAGATWVFPDFSIRDLFFYIDPAMLDDERRRDAPWEAIGLRIIDRITTGQLQVWGREMNLNDRTAPMALVPIAPERWARAEFTYFFIAEDHTNVAHVTCKRPSRGAAPWQYSDLHFNRAQATAIWPESLIVSLPEAASLLREALKGSLKLSTIERKSISEDEVLDQMATLLLPGVPVTGIRPGETQRESVGTAHRWYSEPKGGGKVLRSRDTRPRTIFSDLQVARSDLIGAIAQIKSRAAAGL